MVIFFPTILPEEGLESYYSYDVSKQTFTKKLVFFSEGKILGIFMWRVILVILGMFRNFGHDND